MANREKTHMLGIYVDPALAKELRRLSFRRETTMTGVVKNLIERELGEAKATGELPLKAEVSAV
jgi:hypothetical protein